MKRGKFVSFIRKICITLVFSVCIFTAGYGVGLSHNVKSVFSDITAKAASTNVQNAECGGYSAILSGKWIYVYNGTGTLCDAVYVYTEYMTEEDKAALSCGVEFETEAEMHEFIEGFR